MQITWHDEKPTIYPIAPMLHESYHVGYSTAMVLMLVGLVHAYGGVPGSTVLLVPVGLMSPIQRVLTIPHYGH